ncbi:MAG: hypothetical protein DWQ02_20790 [Bacteroidetes bacterium]|nr:MAG: hypothetical protein DWQ02_20790 [Bacteroidota bacterium]
MQDPLKMRKTGISTLFYFLKIIYICIGVSNCCFILYINLLLKFNIVSVLMYQKNTKGFKSEITITAH